MLPAPFRKVARAILAVLMTVAVFGCGNSNSGNAPTPTPTPTATPTPTSSLTPTPTPTPVSVGQTWNLYKDFSAYYVVPYSSPTPPFGNQMSGANLHVNIVVCDSQKHCTTEHSTALDTGSRGLWLPASIFPSADPQRFSHPGLYLLQQRRIAAAGQLEQSFRKLP